VDLVVWNDSLSVGDALMDAHHQVFFQMVAEDREAARGGDASAEAPATVTSDRILSMMQAWLADHILGLDKQFEPWVARHKAS
jgi:hemerythrin